LSSTVTDARHRVSDAKVKNVSGLVERPRRWWQRKAEPQSPVVERSPFPDPGGDTQILPTVRATEPKPLPPVLYRDRPLDLDKAACNISLVATSATLHRHSAIKLEEDLAVHLRVVHALAERERAEGRKLLARDGNGAQAAAQIAQTLDEIVTAERNANELPGVTVKAEVDTGAFGSELAAVTANQGALGDETTSFQRITPGMPDPRVQVSVTTVTVSKPASPVHVPGDGMAPPVPDEDEVADPGALKPLPKRVPQATTHHVLPATDLDPYEAVDPTLNGHTLPAGAWVYDEGSGTAGPVWFLLAEQRNELRDSGRVAVLRFANGQTRDVHAGGQVRVLDVRRAQVLVAQIEARLAARDGAGVSS